MNQFSKQTIEYFKNNIDNIPPKNNRSILFDVVKPYLKNNFDILEPSAKTGEFILDLNEFDISFNITSLEENKHLYNILQTVPNSNSQNCSFLQLSQPFNFKKYDIILGSPPSFIIDKRNNIGKKFKNLFIDKTDVYSLFFMRAIDLLKPKGIVAFILPDTIFTNPYLQLLRNKICNTGSILHIQRMSNLFTKTIYNTILFVYQKNTPHNNKYTHKIFNNIIFTLDKNKYIDLYKFSQNLHMLHANINYGVDNSKLSRSHKVQFIPIIYQKNIDTDNTLQLFKNNKQYIHPSIITQSIYNKPSLIIYKYIGNKNNPYAIRFCMCTLDKYIVNDNLFVITFPHISNEDSVILINKIIKSLNQEYTTKWIKTFCKDGTISKFQLEQYLPIYI